MQYACTAIDDARIAGTGFNSAGLSTYSCYTLTGERIHRSKKRIEHVCSYTDPISKVGKQIGTVGHIETHRPFSHSIDHLNETLNKGVIYIDYSDYDFRDENQMESSCWCYRDLYEQKTKESQEIVNSQLIEFLDEWRQDAPSRYRKAKDDICYWITDEWYNFESPMQKEIESAYQTALKKKDDLAIALALSPFAQKMAELYGLRLRDASLCL